MSIRERSYKRAAVYAHIAKELISAIPELARECTFRADAPFVLAWAYFLISDAYKPWRNKAGSLTDDYKKAAASALSVMVVRPFAPLDPDNVETRITLLANPIFAIAIGNSWAADRDLLHHYPFDYLKRFYNSLLNVRLPSLAEFIERANEGDDWQSITAIRLSNAETALIDGWVNKFYDLVHRNM